MSKIICQKCHNKKVSCNNCAHFWSYLPDSSSPYGELACAKGHWEGLEDPSDLYKLIECEDFDEQKD